MGVAVDNASIQWAGNKHMEQGPLLITHWGISGPAAIKLSAWCAREMAAVNYEGNIIINWVPTYNEQSLKMEWINFRLELGKREMGSKIHLIYPIGYGIIFYKQQLLVLHLNGPI